MNAAFLLLIVVCGTACFFANKLCIGKKLNSQPDAFVKFGWFILTLITGYGASYAGILLSSQFWSGR